MVSRSLCSKRISLSFEGDSGSSSPELTGSSEIPVTSRTPDCPVKSLTVPFRNCFSPGAALGPALTVKSVFLTLSTDLFPYGFQALALDLIQKQVRSTLHKTHPQRCEDGYPAPWLSLPTRKPQIALPWFYQPPLEVTFASSSAQSNDNKSVYPENTEHWAEWCFPERV